MQFLEQLAQLATEKIQLQIGITVENGIAVISVVPKTKERAWTPFVLRGKPEELDAEFEAGIENLKAGLGFISNASSYAETVKQEVEEAKKTADAEKAKASGSKTAAAPAKKEEPKKPEPKKETKKPDPEPEKDDEVDLDLFS